MVLFITQVLLEDWTTSKGTEYTIVAFHFDNSTGKLKQTWKAKDKGKVKNHSYKFFLANGDVIIRHIRNNPTFVIHNGNFTVPLRKYRGNYDLLQGHLEVDNQEILIYAEDVGSGFNLVQYRADDHSRIRTMQVW